MKIRTLSIPLALAGLCALALPALARQDPAPRTDPPAQATRGQADTTATSQDALQAEEAAKARRRAQARAEKAAAIKSGKLSRQAEEEEEKPRR